jgi:hypothetical protein
MPRLTDEQIVSAREITLFSFLLAQRPDELVRTGANEYRTRTHSSLVITPRYWYWNRGGIGGVSAIDYLVKVCGVSFIEAVREVLPAGVVNVSRILPFQPKERQAKKSERPAFRLPQKAQSNESLKRYLTARGISINVINRCIADGILFESRYLCSPACVFVGKDESGQAKFAALRGIENNIKRDVAGSDKRYSFSLLAQRPSCNTLLVFESPIDVLSHMTLAELGKWEQSTHRLSLAGTSHVALEAFLMRHQALKRVVLHMDGDTAGMVGAIRIKKYLAAGKRFSHIKVSVNPARKGKDYNEQLMHCRAGIEVNDYAEKGGVDHARRNERKISNTWDACR